MTRPPIIISNGGVASELAKDLTSKIEGMEAYQVIKRNVDAMNERVEKDDFSQPHPVAKSLGSKGKARIIWRMSDEETKYKDEVDHDAS